VSYLKEDPSVKAIYLDGHTDSEGIRGENLLKSERRAERVFNYLVESGIDSKTIAMRWHGERYPLATNRTKKGKAQNRRVTVRLSKEPPQFLVNKNSNQAAIIRKEEAEIVEKELIKDDVNKEAVIYAEDASSTKPGMKDEVEKEAVIDAEDTLSIKPSIKEEAEKEAVIDTEDNGANNATLSNSNKDDLLK
jgi:hypothetical protein